MPNTYVELFKGMPALAALRTQRSPQALSLAFDAVLSQVSDIPLPGTGRTLERWRFLHALAAVDLVLAKIVEPHFDALAILNDLNPDDHRSVSSLATGMACFGAVGLPPTTPAPQHLAGAKWAVWAAEPPDARVEGRFDPNGALLLTGRKSWCSGARLVSHALITYWTEDGQSALAAIAMSAPGVTLTEQGWHAVGMDASDSVDIVLDQVVATPVGGPGAYLARPGFWHGGMGVAACWLGGAYALASVARERVGARQDPHALAHIGAMDVALAQAQGLMRATAAWVDAHPDADSQWPAFRLRAAAERCATDVLMHSGRAVGAGPLCRDPYIAKLYADLPIFIRQSHAERDLAGLGAAVVAVTTDARVDPWML